MGDEPRRSYPRKPGVHRLSGNFKTEKPSYKVKHSVANPVEKQAVFENHHEPIIDRETWERVQELRKQRKRPNRYDEVGLFSGMPVSYTHLFLCYPVQKPHQRLLLQGYFHENSIQLGGQAKER